MIIFGNIDTLKYIITLKIEGIPAEPVGLERLSSLFNFNTLYEGAERLSGLNPYWDYNNGNQIYVNEEEFDKWYVNYLTTTPEAFRELIDILRVAYNGDSVYILCDWNNEISVNMIEGLIKFITDSYGYVCNVMKTPEDIEGAKEGTFSADGVQLYDANMETYIKMFGTRNLQSDPEE